jgi:hypothetical protein
MRVFRQSHLGEIRLRWACPKEKNDFNSDIIRIYFDCVAKDVVVFLLACQWHFHRIKPIVDRKKSPGPNFFVFGESGCCYSTMITPFMMRQWPGKLQING